MAFNDQLRKARCEAGLTQFQMAQKIGVARTTYTGYETGNGRPTVETIQKIMSVLSVDANYLWHDEMEDNQD